MAEIPYVPVPQVKNSEASGAMISVPNANAQAFGAGVGEAMTRMGAAIGHASDVAGQKAIEFQNIQNETKANDILLAGSTALAQEELKLKSLEGQNAVNYLPEYNKNVQDIRQKIVGDADNSAVARLVDNALRQKASSVLISGATYGAGAARSAREASRTGVISMEQTRASSASDMEFDQSVGTIEKMAREQAVEKFGEGAAADAFVQTQVNEAYVKRLETKSMTDPYGAKEFLDKNRAKFTADGYQRGLQVVNQTAVQVGSRNIAQKTAPESQQMSAFAGAVKAIESGDYNNIGPMNKKGTDRPYGAYQVMGENIGPWTKEVLGVALTKEQFLGNKEAQDKVFAVKFKQSIDKYGSAIDAASVWFTGKPASENVTATDSTGTSQSEYLRRFRSALATTGIGNDVTTPQVPSAADTAAWVKRAREEATKQFPDNPAVADQAEARVLQTVGRQSKVKSDYESQQFSAVTHAVSGLGRDKPPTTLDELLGDDPKMRQAYFSLTPEHQAATLKVLKDNAEGKVKVWSPEAIQEEARVRGLAETNPEEFKRLFIPGLPIPKEGIDKLQKMQDEAVQGKVSDGSLTQALGVVKSTGVLDQLGIEEGSDRYNAFVGVLQKSIDTWRLENPRAQGPVPADALRKMIPELVKNIPLTNNKIMANESKPLFELDPNKAASSAVGAARNQTQIMTSQGIPENAINPLAKAYYVKNGVAGSTQDLINMYFSSPRVMKQFPPTKSIPWLTPRGDK